MITLLNVCLCILLELYHRCYSATTSYVEKNRKSFKKVLSLSSPFHLSFVYVRWDSGMKADYGAGDEIDSSDLRVSLAHHCLFLIVPFYPFLFFFQDFRQFAHRGETPWR